MPSINVSALNINNGSGGVPTDTGTAFIVIKADQGPPPGGAGYVRCLSMSDYVNAWGPRSAVTAASYDWANEFFADGGQQLYTIRDTDNTAATASLTLQDASAHPTVVVSALTPGTDGNSIYIAVTTGSGNATVLVEDSAGDVLETHGPYTTQAALLADTTSSYVSFSQSAGSGFTSALPTTLSSAHLTGGADASDLSDTTAVNALAGFPKILGPGTVALPGYTSITAWNGLDAHAVANNRFAAKDIADSSVVATLEAAISGYGAGQNASYGLFTVGQAILPGLTPGTFRYAAGSACVAALRAQVATTLSQNQAPAGVNWPLSYPVGFTEFYGPAGATNLPAGSFSQADVNSLSAAGINVFANLFGVLCLYGFVSPVSKQIDSTFWQASAACERMALVSEAGRAMLPFEFATIDGAGKTILAATTALKGIVNTHWSNNALYGATAGEAGVVVTGPPINTPATESQGQLNGQLQVRLSPYADTVNIQIGTVPITQTLPVTQP